MMDLNQLREDLFEWMIHVAAEVKRHNDAGNAYRTKRATQQLEAIIQATQALDHAAQQALATMAGQRAADDDLDQKEKDQ